MTTHCRDLTDTEIATFRRERVVCVKQIIGEEFLQRLRTASYAQQQNPTRWAGDFTEKDSTGQFFMDRHMHAYQTHWREILFESGQGRVAAQAMGVAQIRAYFDHLWMHAPNTPQDFDWHQDLPYWPFKGRDICSIWIALEPDSTIEFVRGSGTWGKWFRPVLPGGEITTDLKDWVGASYQDEMPDFGADPARWEFITYEIEAGDAIVFDGAIVHKLPGNLHPTRWKIGLSTRFLGDEAYWDPRPGTDPIIGQDDVQVQPGARAVDPAFPLLWQNGEELRA